MSDKPKIGIFSVTIPRFWRMEECADNDIRILERPFCTLRFSFYDRGFKEIRFEQ